MEKPGKNNNNGEQIMKCPLKQTFLFLMFIVFLGFISPSFGLANVVTVSNVKELMETVPLNAKGDLTVLIEDGTYELPNRIDITGDDVTYKSLSGNRSSVILKGRGHNGSVGNIFSIMGEHVKILDMSIGEVKWHAVQIHGEHKAGDVVIRNVRLYDTGEQMIKGSYDKTKPDNFIDSGLIEDCLFEFTTGKAFQFYTGGIDIIRGENWIVRNNRFKNIVNPGGKLTTGTILFWNNSRNVVVSGNIITNCDRGILFGLDNSPLYNGLIMNNFIHTTVDTGIYLCNASGVEVLNNTIFVDSGYPHAIEYRFKDTFYNTIANNLTNRAIRSRDGGSAEVYSNVSSAKKNWFVDASQGDLHLDERIDEVHGRGVYFSVVVSDIDGETRTPGTIDIGADQNDGIEHKVVDRLVLSSDKPAVWNDGYEPAYFKVEAVYGDGTQKEVEADEIVCLDRENNAIGTQAPSFSTSMPGTYRCSAKLDGIQSNAVNIQVHDVSTKKITGLNARHVEGQTFLTFDMITDYFAEADITYGAYFDRKKRIQADIKYNIYRSTRPIQEIGDSTPLATVDSFTGWNELFYGIETSREKYSNKTAIRYTVNPEDGPLDAKKGLFVFNPDDAGNFYYAVAAVIDDRESREVAIAENSLEIPVEETRGQGLPVLQRVEMPESFQYIKNAALHFYTRWEAPPNAGNNTMPFDYLVAIPENLKDPAPVGIHMHAWGGNLTGGYAWWNNAEKGAILLASNQRPYDWWTGYHENLFSRNPPRSKEEWTGGVVKPYTANRLFSFLEYLDERSDWPIDLERTFAAGSSMGGSGSLMMAIRYPERIAWARSWVGVHIPEKSPTFKSSYASVWGPPDYNVKFEDGTPVWDYYNNAKYLYANPRKEIGFLTFSNGKNDGGIGWAQAVEFFRALQDTKRPHLFIWGQGGHGQRTIMPGNGNERVMPLDIRTDAALPAFTNCSLDDDPGNGDPADGDPSGQINRWLYWDDDSILDAKERFAITVALMDAAPAPDCIVDITPRRVQQFRFSPGTTLFWKNVDNTGAAIQDGTVTVDADGLITLKKAIVSKSENKIMIDQQAGFSR